MSTVAPSFLGPIPARLAISRFPAPATTSTRPTLYELTWPELVAFLSTHERWTDKDQHGWSPATYKEGKTRANKNAGAVSCFVGDADHATLEDYEAIRAHLDELGLAYVLYSTYGNDPPDDFRFRIVVPLVRPVTGDDQATAIVCWRDVWARATGHVLMGRNDQHTKDLSRFFYPPSAPPDVAVFAQVGEGLALDWEALPELPTLRVERNGQAAAGAVDYLGYATLHFLAFGAPVGQQRGRALGATRALLSSGKSVEETAGLVWDALRKSPCGDPDNPWTEEHALAFAEDLADREPTPLPPQPSGQLVAPTVGTAPSYVSPQGAPPSAARSIPVPPFPVDVLPEVARRLVLEGAAAMGAPPDMIAVPLLGYAGAAIGRQQELQLKQGWWERPVLYVAVVAQPGSVKTPTQNLARWPLDVLQNEAWAAYRERLVAYKAAHREWEKTPPKERGEEPKRPTLEHFFTTDATLEAIAAMLHGRPGGDDGGDAGSPGLALSLDEVVTWVRACDAYRGGRGGDRQRWLSMWAGAPLKVDRKTGEPIYVTHPVVPVVGGIQPDLLSALADEAGRRDGFVERILWAYPDTAPVGWSEAEVSWETRSAVVELFRRMRSAPAALASAGGLGARCVRLSPEAKALWVAWFDENSRLTAAASGVAAGVYAKLPNQLARLTLILHCLTHPDNPSQTTVSAETIGGAIELAEYFRAHARRVLPAFNASASAASAGLVGRVERILSRAGGEWVSREDVSRKLGGHVPSADVGAALETLEEQAAAERRSVQTEGRPREEWRALIAEKRRNVESPPDEGDVQPQADLSTFLRFSAEAPEPTRPPLGCIRPGCVGRVPPDRKLYCSDECQQCDQEDLRF